MPKTWKYTVTFESPETAPPETVRLDVAAGSVSTAAARAIREARRSVPKRVFESVQVLIERPTHEAVTGGVTA
ncbi:MAG: hypothetical protein NTV05_08355 [Acidobacteria bacterium]|nr:hypothetical protein [Acidobacteriota bacterium]